MHITFRVDASRDIGTGHLMRCLTLAQALKERGAKCHFIVRDHPGSLVEGISSRGFRMWLLPTERAPLEASAPERPLPPTDAPWAAAHWQTDAEQTAVILKKLQPRWLIVDHYGFDAQWESALRLYCGSLMVIDDLADRPHYCELLLDQTFGRAAADYGPLVPQQCKVLAGAKYALLRPEFAAMREISLPRRANAPVKKLLISMGGGDQCATTCRVMVALQRTALPDDCAITVVAGTGTACCDALRATAAMLRWAVEVKVNVRDMAGLMCESDLAIGGAGATSWERCCVGLPSIVIVLARNQQGVAAALREVGAARIVPEPAEIEMHLPTEVDGLVRSAQSRSDMSRAASLVTDGSGTAAVVRTMDL